MPLIFREQCGKLKPKTHLKAWDLEETPSVVPAFLMEAPKVEEGTGEWEGGGAQGGRGICGLQLTHTTTSSPAPPPPAYS